MFETIVKRWAPASIQSLIRAILRRHSIRRFGSKIVQHNYGGVELKVSLADPVGAEWYDKDWPELVEFRFLKNYSLRHGAKVFDLGAHQCVVAMMLSAAVGDSGSVVALEANQHNAEIAAKNLSLNLCTNVTLLNVAIAATTGRVTFNEMLNGQVDGGERTHGVVEIASRTVDDLAREFGHPNLLFVDVEGYECEVLLGSKQTLAKGVDCFIEVHSGCGLEKFGGSIERLLGFLPEERFARFFSEADGNPFLPLGDVRCLEGKRWLLIATQKHRALYV